MRTRRVHRRSDPRAAILSDWFGIKNLAALVLVELYERPMTMAALQRKLGRRAIQQSLAELRIAGLPVPWANKWHPLYNLGPDGREQVAEAYRNAAALLAPDMMSAAEERIAALEAALGVNIEDAPEFGLTRSESHVYGMLAKAGGPVGRERIMLALYGFRDDAPDTKIVDVMICHMRPKLKRHGLGIVVVRGEGFKLVDERPVRTAA